MMKKKHNVQKNGRRDVLSGHPAVVHVWHAKRHKCSRLLVLQLFPTRNGRSRGTATPLRAESAAGSLTTPKPIPPALGRCTMQTIKRKFDITPLAADTGA